MKKQGIFFLCLLSFSCSGWAWSPTTHAYIASCVTEGQNLSVIYGSGAADLNSMVQGNPAETEALRVLTHYEWERLAPSAFTTGFKTHNEEWGADFYSHTADTWARSVMTHLRDHFGITMTQAHVLFESCVDFQVRLAHGPELGTLLANAAEASGEEHEQLMVDAYAGELAARVSGLTVEQAEADIRLAMQMLRASTIALGELMETPTEDIEEVMLPVIAMYLGVTESEVRPYYEYAMEVTADFQEHLDYVCEQVKLEMPNAYEGESEGEDEGEDEGEGEPPAPTVVDFCTAFYSVYTNPLLQGLDPEFAAFIELLNPLIADVNGTFSVDMSDGGLNLSVSGNGIPDAANELGLLGYVLNNPSQFPPNKGRSAVLNHDTLHAAWIANRNRIKADIGTGLTPILSALAPGLIEVLTGFITLGDGDFTITSLPTESEPELPIIVSGTGSFGLVAALFAVVDGLIRDWLGSGFANPYIQRENYITFPELLSQGDADGDTCPNIEEFNWFTPDVCVILNKDAQRKGDKGNDPSITYVQAALDYRICPSCENGCPDCKPAGGYYEVGDKACLRVPGSFAYGTEFDWSKEGTGILLGSRYEGLDCQTLLIHNLDIGDSGAYVCTYGPERNIYRANIKVVDELPLSSNLLIFILLMVLSVLGFAVNVVARSNKK
jgi:hypothetical protein